MPVKICIVNEKGGVAKTTTAEALAAAFTRKGLKTLLLDMDPQCNATNHCNFGNVREEEMLTLYDVLSPLRKPHVALSECVQHLQDYDIAPASREMSSLELEFTSKMLTYTTHLADAFEEDPAIRDYDIILMDCGPQQGALNVNVLCSADYCLIPTECRQDSKDAIANVFQTILAFKKRQNPNLQILGVAITKYERVTKLGREIKDEIVSLGEAGVGIRVFDTPIRQCSAVEKAKNAKRSILDFDPRCTAAIDYMSLAEEILSVLNQKGGLE